MTEQIISKFVKLSEQEKKVVSEYVKSISADPQSFPEPAFAYQEEEP